MSTHTHKGAGWRQNCLQSLCLHFSCVRHASLRLNGQMLNYGPLGAMFHWSRAYASLRKLLLWHTSMHTHSETPELDFCVFCLLLSVLHINKCKNWCNWHNCLMYVRRHTHTHRDRYTHTIAADCGLWLTVRYWKGSWELTLLNVKAPYCRFGIQLGYYHMQQPPWHTPLKRHTQMSHLLSTNIRAEREREGT